MRTSLSLLLLPSTLLISSVSFASQTYPDEVRKAVPTLSCAPQCTLCHQTTTGGPPASKPFAADMKARGLGLANPASVAPAIQKLMMDGIAADADKDGKSDFDELVAGTDPNSADPTATLCTEVPLYGCGASTIARHAPSGGATPFWFAGIAVALGAVARRFKRR